LLILILVKLLHIQAEGLTAIEVWMLTCILFVFGKLSYNYSKMDTLNFLLVRKSQILNFLGSFRNREMNGNAIPKTFPHRSVPDG
jgi:hypothetical protein